MFPLFLNNYEENCAIYTVTLDNKAADFSKKGGLGFCLMSVFMGAKGGVCNGNN